MCELFCEIDVAIVIGFDVVSFEEFAIFILERYLGMMLSLGGNVLL
jgi:hypothetical protein